MYAKEVTHPGIPPQHYMSRAADNVAVTIGPRINARASQSIRRYIK